MDTDLEGYRRFLVDRDGQADVLNRRLSGREAFFDRMGNETVASSRHFDEATFTRNLHRRRSEPGLSKEMYWLIATAKLNQAERFGVGLSAVYGRNCGADAPTEKVYIELEEHYHSRLLAGVVDMFDLPYEVVAPALVTRQFVKFHVFLPDRLARPFLGAAEMAGSMMFQMVGEAGVRLFADEPAVAERIALLYEEILTDELGHVGFCAASLGPAGRRVMRRLYPPVLRILCLLTPQVTEFLDPGLLTRRLTEPFDLAGMVAERQGHGFAAAYI